MPHMPASVIATTIQASPITFSYTETACATAPSAAGRLPASRSSENAQQNTSIAHVTSKLVTLHSCAAAQCAIVGAMPSGSVTPTSTW